MTRLPLEQRRQVLEFARALVTAKVHGVPGKNLLHFAGAIDSEDLMDIKRAIEDGCEKIIPDGGDITAVWKDKKRFTC